MLDKLFARFRGDNEPDDTSTYSPLASALAALLVEAARADEEYTDQEKALIDHMLSHRFELGQDEAQELRARAEDAQAESNDLYGFSRVVKAEMSYEEKCGLIEDMWVIALSDSDKAPYEEMIIRRLVGLIHVEDVDNAAARRRAEARISQQAAGGTEA